jgi:hypothetical protein
VAANFSLDPRNYNYTSLLSVTFAALILKISPAGTLRVTVKSSFVTVFSITILPPETKLIPAA